MNTRCLSRRMPCDHGGRSLLGQNRAWGNAEPRAAPDCLQRPLVPRFRFRQQVSASVGLQKSTRDE